MLADCVFALFDIRPPAEVARVAADAEIAAESAAAEGCAYPTALVVDELLSHDFALFLGVGENHDDLDEDRIQIQFIIQRLL